MANGSAKFMQLCWSRLGPGRGASGRPVRLEAVRVDNALNTTLPGIFDGKIRSGDNATLHIRGLAT